MNARNEDLLKQAKQQGYLVMPYGKNKTLKSRYWEWCKSQKIPAITVTFHGISAIIDTNTEPVLLGYYRTDTPIDGEPDFAPTPELEERLKSLSPKLLASVSRGNRGRALVHPSSHFYARYVGQEAAIEAAKELVDIWQEAKQHLVFWTDDDM